MNKKLKRLLIIDGVFIFLSLAITLIVLLIDRRVINNTGKLGMATLNMTFFEFTGKNKFLYELTNWFGILAIGLAGIFAILGFLQLIKTKSIKKVDINLICLGIIYLLTIVTYLIFEVFVVNNSPNSFVGIAKSSFPSTHTLISIVIFVTAIPNVDTYVKNNKLKTILKILLVVITFVMIVGRLYSGAHWLTDIVAGIYYGGLLVVNYFLLNLLLNKNSNSQDNIQENKISEDSISETK